LREVQAGAFREDLFYRLNVLAITIPDLRDRPDDILPLAESFLGRHADASGPKLLSPDAVKLLRAYHWPGNVRELENVIHRASIMTDDQVIDPAALEISLDPAAHAPARPGGPARLKTLERDAIMSMLEHNGGNRTKTAAALGISIRTLRNKLNRYELGVA
jgi:DNA-binding NtrC family response regulator